MSRSHAPAARRPRIARQTARSLLLLSLVAAACGGNVEELPGAQGDLLAGRSPSASSGAHHVSRMTDGFVANEGGFWRTDPVCGRSTS